VDEEVFDAVDVAESGRPLVVSGAQVNLFWLPNKETELQKL